MAVSDGFSPRGAPPVQAIAVAIGLHTVWGANTVAVKFGLLAFPPFTTAALRFAIGIVCVAAIAAWFRSQLWPQRQELPGLIVLGLIFAVQVALMNFGFDLTSGALGSVLLSTYPLFAALFARFISPDERLNPGQIVGLMIAFIGAGVVLWRDPEGDMDWVGLGNWLVLTSGALLGFRMAFSAKLLRGIDALKVTFWQMAFSLPLFVLPALALESVAWDRLAWPPVLGLLYQGVLIAGFSYAINYVLMRRYNPAVIVSFGFVSPISGVLVSAWLLGDVLDWSVGLGTAGVAAGLILITRRPRVP